MSHRTASTNRTLSMFSFCSTRWLRSICNLSFVSRVRSCCRVKVISRIISFIWSTMVLKSERSSWQKRQAAISCCNIDVICWDDSSRQDTLLKRVIRNLFLFSKYDIVKKGGGGIKVRMLDPYRLYRRMQIRFYISRIKTMVLKQRRECLIWITLLIMVTHWL